MDARELGDLLTHMEWADALTWRAIRTLPAAQSDERVKWLTHHVHLVQAIYLQAWQGEPFQLTELTSYPDLAAIEVWGRTYYPRAAAFAGAVAPLKFAQPVDFPWTAMIDTRFGKVLPATLGESAWQVLSHTTYHRGQLAVRIRELGGEPPVVDFLYWVWEGKPAPGWDTESP